MKIRSKFTFHEALNCCHKKHRSLKKYSSLSEIHERCSSENRVWFLSVSTIVPLASLICNRSVFRSRCILFRNLKTVHKIADIWIFELFPRMFRISNISFCSYTSFSLLLHTSLGRVEGRKDCWWLLFPSLGSPPAHQFRNFCILPHRKEITAFSLLSSPFPLPPEQWLLSGQMPGSWLPVGRSSRASLLSLFLPPSCPFPPCKPLEEDPAPGSGRGTQPWNRPAALVKNIS